MAKYKIVGQNSDLIRVVNSDESITTFNKESWEYEQFIEDVKEQGLSIVEGADLTTDSYVELRQKEYPSLSDQQDLQYWDQENGTTYWIDMIRTIKNKYPKSIIATTKVQPLPEWVQQLVE